MEKEIGDILLMSVQRGILFPQRNILRVLNGKYMEDDIAFLESKTRVLLHLKKTKKAYISELCEQFKTSPEEMIKILKKLKKEGLVKEIV